MGTVSRTRPGSRRQRDPGASPQVGRWPISCRKRAPAGNRRAPFAVSRPTTRIHYGRSRHANASRYASVARAHFPAGAIRASDPSPLQPDGFAPDLIPVGPTRRRLDAAGRTNTRSCRSSITPPNPASFDTARWSSRNRNSRGYVLIYDGVRRKSFLKGTANGKYAIHDHHPSPSRLVASMRRRQSGGRPGQLWKKRSVPARGPWHVSRSSGGRRSREALSGDPAVRRSSGLRNPSTNPRDRRRRLDRQGNEASFATGRQSPQHRA
jgi:hypothetical protein